VGSPRSGTSWLAKIFDSHPNVLYRHEPDSVLRSHSIPSYCSELEQLDLEEQARDYIAHLLDVRVSKVVGSLPIFSKQFQSSPKRILHQSMTLSVKAFERVGPLSTFFRSLQIPDFLDLKTCHAQIVIKSISAMGRLGLFLNALPKSKAILIIRHPCGHVASVLRGVQLEKFDSRIPITEDVGVYEMLAGTDLASKYDLSLDRFMSMDPILRLAWRWALFNERVIEQGSFNDRLHILRYEDLCDDATSIAKKLFQFSSLSWNPQTAKFVENSTRARGSEGFYQIYRNPIQSATKWKSELSADQIESVIEAVRYTRPGKLFFGA